MTSTCQCYGNIPPTHTESSASIEYADSFMKAVVVALIMAVILVFVSYVVYSLKGLSSPRDDSDDDSDEFDHTSTVTDQYKQLYRNKFIATLEKLMDEINITEGYAKKAPLLDELYHLLLKNKGIVFEFGKLQAVVLKKAYDIQDVDEYKNMHLPNVEEFIKVFGNES